MSASLTPVMWQSKNCTRLSFSAKGNHTKFVLDDPECTSIIQDAVSRCEGTTKGATFLVQLKPTRSAWKGWNALEEAGLEIMDIRSAQNESFTVDPPYHPANLQKLLLTMPDSNGKINDKNKGKVWITVTPRKEVLTPEQLAALTEQEVA